MAGGLKVEFDTSRDEITVEGIRYAGDMFRALGRGKDSLGVGEPLRIVARDDKLGSFTIQRYYGDQRECILEIMNEE